jgi:hypothetical protein
LTIGSLTPAQQARRGRIEGLIGLAAPALDAILALGERISRLAGPEDDHYPAAPPGEGLELPPRPSQRSAGREDGDEPSA